jgi:hypothetical protein
VHHHLGARHPLFIFEPNQKVPRLLDIAKFSRDFESPTLDLSVPLHEAPRTATDVDSRLNDVRLSTAAVGRIQHERIARNAAQMQLRQGTGGRQRQGGVDA